MPHPSVTFDWADGTYTFCLPNAQIGELQDKTGVGPMRLFRRLQSGDWLDRDMAETIRLGLIGGGMAPVKALGLVRRYVDERPKVESIEPAVRILGSYLIGVPDDPVGKTQAAGGMNGHPSPPTAESPSPASTRSASN